MRANFVALMLVLSGTAVAAPLGDSVVFPAARALDLLDQCSRDIPDVSGYWLPEPALITELDNGFEQAAKAELVKRGEQFPAQGYDRQYAGIIVHGQRRIYINAFIHELAESGKNAAAFPPADFWRTNAILVCDGGSYYFGAVYDPATKVFSDFAFNGIKR